MKWTPPLLLDLEYFLRLDHDNDPEDLHKRDRAFFLNVENKGTDPGLIDTSQQRASLLFTWLYFRKNPPTLSSPQTQSVSPGQVVASALHSLTIYTSLAALCTGFSLAMTLLSYSGKAPINVFTYLSVLILPQFLLLLGLVFFLGIKRSAHAKFHISPTLFIFRKSITGLAKKLGNRFLQTLSGSQRNAFVSTLGLISSYNQTYGKLFAWPLFSLTQCFGIMFNVGALGATLLKILGSDLAFGWQSTLQISARAAYNVITTIALPWSWIIPESVAHPSLEQIAGSKMLLKEGIYHLATQNLVSWWPFLCFALICYGLIPRVMLYVFAHYATDTAVRNHPFSSPNIDRLLFRMRTPLVDTTPRDFSYVPPVPAPAPLPEVETPTAEPPIVEPPKEALAILIPEELTDQCPLEELYQAVHRGTGVKPSRHVSLDPYDQETVLDSLRNSAWQENRARIAVLQEAWQPPIRELLDLIQSLADVTTPAASITIALIGKPAPATILTPPDPLNTQVWKDQIARLANPAIEVIELGTSHEH